MEYIFYYSVLLFLLAITFILMYTLYIYLYRRKYAKIYNIYKNRLLQYLSPHKELVPMIFPDIEKKMNSKVLTDMIFNLMLKVDGTEAKIMTLIFRSNGLTDYVSKYGGKGSKRQLCRALNVFSRFPARISSIFTLGHYLYDKDRDVRMFALIAFFMHDPQRLSLTLKNYPYRLMMRDYANIYDFCVRNSSDINYELLEKSRNKSVVNFSRQLIKLKGKIK